MAKWQWDATRKRYRNATSGRWLPGAALARMRDGLVEGYAQAFEEATRDLHAGHLTPAEWQADVRRHLKSLWGQQLLLGRGGREAVTKSDWGALGARLREQYRYLRGFTQEHTAGGVSEAQGVARARQYAGASVAGYELGHSRAWGLGAAGQPALPRFPGSGSTACGANCRCHLTYREDAGAWYVTWNLGAVRTEHCADCPPLAEAWSPLRVPKSPPLETLQRRAKTNGHARDMAGAMR